MNSSLKKFSISTLVALMLTSVGFAGFSVYAAPQATAKASESAEVKLSAEQLKAYEGQYQLVPGFVITISEKDAKLMAQATGQPSFEIFALGEHRFFAKVADIKLQFKLNCEGKAEGMTLFQIGQQMPAPRVK